MTRRERLERKLERRREWAEKAEDRSKKEWSTGDKMFSVIPLGQPILIGHHSEKRDRNYRNRAAGHLDKACALGDLAKHHESKADGLETQLDRAIFSDDQNAIEALQERIAENEAKRERMKKVNALYRKGDAAGLALLGVDLEQLKAKLAAAGSYWGSAPHLAYELQNLGQRITGDRNRVELIKKQNARRAEAQAAPNGVTVKERGDYASVTFAEKPSREILHALRNAGFHWSAPSWSGYTAKLPEAVRELLQPKEAPCPEPESI